MHFEYKDRCIYTFEDGQKKLLAKNVSNKYFIDKNTNAILYLSNSKQWDMGDLHLKRKDYEDEVIDENVRIIEISNTLERVTYLQNYSDDNNSENFLTGNLCILENLKNKRIIDREVYVGSLILENEDGSYRIYYTKRLKNTSEIYRMYILNEKGKEQFSDEYLYGKIAIYRDENDKMIVKYFKPTSTDDYEVEGDIILYQEYENKKTILQKDISIYDASKSFESRDDILKYDDIKEKYKDKIKGKEILNISNDEDIYYRIYYTKSIKKKYYIGHEISSRARKHKILNNIFPDDDSENNIAVFDEKQTRDMVLAYDTIMPFIYQDSGIEGYNIYGVEARDILKACENFKGYNMDYRQEYNYNSYMLKDSNFILYAEEVRNYLMKMLGISSKNILGKLIMHEIIKPIQAEHERCLRFIVDSNIRNELNIKEEKRKVEEQLIIENKLPTKWKSEQQLFKLIKKYFPTAEMHSMPSWLTPQHLDVFLPQHLIAFEYQGRQHYEPVDFFGGHERFIDRVKLDKKKKRLCKENNVILIEWKFNEPITANNLKNKLKNIDVKI